MTLASRITDLVTALATALNARNAPGPSDYQLWVAQGNTGSIADYRTAMIGSDVDYATLFQNQLGAVPSSGAASETQAGITQLATLAEVLQGNTAKAVSAGRLPIRYAASLAALDALTATNPTPGTLAVVSGQTTNSGSLQPSYWRFATDQKWQPALPLRASNTAVPANDLKALFASYPSLKPEPFESRCIAFSNGSDPSGGYDEYIWIGTTTGFFLWKGALPVTAGSGYALNNRYNALRVMENQIHLSFSIQNRSGTTPAGNDLIVQLNNYGQYIGPGSDLLTSGASNNNNLAGGWQPQALFINNAGVRILGNPPSNGSGEAASIFGGTLSWIRPLPTI